MTFHYILKVSIPKQGFDKIREIFRRNIVRWVNARSELVPAPNPRIVDWLTKPYILSQALRLVCTSLTVRVLSQERSHALDDENAKLNLADNALPLVREVFLEGDGIPFTYGRVVVPPDTYQTYFNDFENLASRPIGETLLYNNPNSRRSAFEYATIEIGLLSSLAMFNQILWGRRSIFTLGDSPLLVTEIFLPTLPDYPDK